MMLDYDSSSASESEESADERTKGKAGSKNEDPPILAGRPAKSHAGVSLPSAASLFDDPGAAREVVCGKRATSDAFLNASSEDSKKKLKAPFLSASSGAAAEASRPKESARGDARPLGVGMLLPTNPLAASEGSPPKSRVLVPPQLRRPNTVTEDAALWTSKATTKK